MSEGSGRRFTNKFELDPQSVLGLADHHAALVENRTMFPSTVITVTETAPDRLLVSGRNNRKLGAVVEKGRWSGHALYGLSLEERRTCPLTCSVRDICYGNGMQLARRHRIGDRAVFFGRLEAEIKALMGLHGGKLLLRLHVLGDFPDVDYVGFWVRMLDFYPGLVIYGYTRRLPSAKGGDAIGDAIAAVKIACPDRFRIRISGDEIAPDGAMVIDHWSENYRPPAKTVVCPAQTEATGCCATCGLCWEPTAADLCIQFVKHGRHSTRVAADHINDQRVAAAAARGRPDVYPIAKIQMPATVKPAKVVAGGIPVVRMARPTDMVVEAAYQRDISPASVRLIRKIVAGWDWKKFKPPICVEDGDRLFVIDGQHTSIAAASHPDITEIPVLIVPAQTLESRAGSFVAHNRDRVSMSASQVFLADITAGDAAAVAIDAVIRRVGASVPRSPPMRGRAKPGQIVSVDAVRRIYAAHGEARLEQILRIAVMSHAAPIASTLLRALLTFLTARDDRYQVRKRVTDEQIALAIKQGSRAAPGTIHEDNSAMTRQNSLALQIARRLDAMVRHQKHAISPDTMATSA